MQEKADHYGRVAVLAAMMCLGLFAVLSQVMFMRELLVVFLGNELGIGAALGSWMAGVSLGALAARLLGTRLKDPHRIRWALTVVMVFMAGAVPLQMWALRTIRLLLQIPPNAYAPLVGTVTASFVIFLPTCAGMGLASCLACQALCLECGVDEPSDDASVVSGVYRLKSIGGVLGGVALSCWLLHVLSPLQIVLASSAVALAGSAFMCPRTAFRVMLSGCAALVVALLCVMPDAVRRVEDFTIRARWRSFGVPVSGADPGGRLVGSSETVYQSLALTEAGDQYALFSNGRRLFVFPDPDGYKALVDVLVSRNPDARRVLVIGGNPLGELSEILKHPVDRVVHVEVDPGIGRLVATVAPAEAAAVYADQRVERIQQGSPVFVRSWGDDFDLVFVLAPDPTTASANRFYTEAFYREIRGIVAANGFICTTAPTSERLRSGHGDLGASVYQTLRQVFPVVRVLSEPRPLFVAGMQANPADLAAGGDGDVAAVEDRLAARDAPINTGLRPIAYLYNLMLWCRSDRSAAGALLDVAQGIKTQWVEGGLFVAGGLFIVLGVAIGIRQLNQGRGLTAAGSRRGAWARLMIGLVIGSTGFCGVALEILLLFVLQALYGYVYTRLGLIVAVFLLGLSMGVGWGRSLACTRLCRPRVVLGGLEVVLAMVALAIPVVLKLATKGGGLQPYPYEELSLYAAMALVGGVVGAEFAVGSRVFHEAGGRLGASAAVLHASDQAGAALGCVLVAIFMVPVLGIGRACAFLAALKWAGLMCVASAVAAMPREEPDAA